MAETRLQKLLQKKAQIEEQLKQQQRIEAEKERKRDTRRKVITGAVIQEYASPELTEAVNTLMKQHVKERDRHLFPELFTPDKDGEESPSLRREFQAQETPSSAK